MSFNIDIRLKRASKIYHEGEFINGVVLFQTNSDFKHDGIFVTVEGSVNLQLSSKNVGIFEAFYNSVKPIQLVQNTVEIAPAGKISNGKTEMAFELLLRPKGTKVLYETYHGVFINIQYNIRCDIKRNFLAKDITKSLELIVEDKIINKIDKSLCKTVPFKIIPKVMQNNSEKSNSPRFLITGKIDSLQCRLSEPFTGEVVIDSAEAAIKSIELQLVRVETCGCAEGYSRDATEVQNIQIGEGNVCTGLAIPIYMIFPRLFTCPTLVSNNFKVEFEVNIIVIFEDDYIVTENFPIVLTRH